MEWLTIIIKGRVDWAVGSRGKHDETTSKKGKLRSLAPGEEHLVSGSLQNVIHSWVTFWPHLIVCLELAGVAV